MRMPLFKVESIKRSSKPTAIERYVDEVDSSQSYWRVKLQHVQVPTIQNIMEFETETEALRFKAGLYYDPAEILDLWNRFYPDMAFWSIGTYQPLGIWTQGIKYDAQELILTGNSASSSPAIRLRMPSVSFGLRRYGTGNGLKMIDIFGTVPAIPQPTPEPIDYPPPPPQPGLDDPQGPPATPGPLDDLPTGRQPGARSGVLLPATPDYPNVGQGTTLGTFQGRDVVTKGYETRPPSSLWRFGPTYLPSTGYAIVVWGPGSGVEEERGTEYTFSRSDFSGIYLTAAAKSRYGLSYIYDSPAGWYNDRYFKRNEFYSFLIEARGLTYGDKVEWIGGAVYDIANTSIPQTWYIVNGGAAGYYDPAGDVANKYYASGTFSSPRNGWFTGRYVRN